jgi:hypothetical protein
VAETVFEQPGNLFAQIALHERQIMQIQKLGLDLLPLNPPPKLCPINRVRVKNGAVFMQKAAEAPGFTVVLQSRRRRKGLPPQLPLVPPSQSDDERGAGRFHAPYRLVAGVPEGNIDHGNSGCAKVVGGATIGKLRNIQPAVPETHVADNVLPGKMNALKQLGDSIGTEN